MNPQGNEHQQKIEGEQRLVLTPSNMKGQGGEGIRANNIEIELPAR